MAKRVADEEWLPKDAKKKKAKPAAQSTALPRPEGLAQEQDRFLNQHKAYIIKEYEDGETYATIARALVTKAGLRDEAVKPKDISNWIDYRKRTGQIKTRRVNAKNKNIKATDSDCMIAVFSCC